MLQTMGAAGAGALLGWPARSAFAQGGKKLTVGSLAFPNWCQLAAAEKFGWLKDEGVDGKFEVRYFESGPPEIEAGIGGSLQLMGLGAGPVINALAAGALPMRILGSVNEVTPLFGLVAQKGFEKIQDLRGKKIACTLGTNYQYFLEAALADAGMTAKDVTVINSQPNEGTISFVAGRVDATVPDYTDIKLIPRRVEGAKVILSAPEIGKTNGIPFASSTSGSHRKKPSTKTRPRWPASCARSAAGPILSAVLRPTPRPSTLPSTGVRRFPARHWCAATSRPPWKARISSMPPARKNSRLTARWRRRSSNMPSSCSGSTA